MFYNIYFKFRNGRTWKKLNHKSQKYSKDEALRIKKLREEKFPFAEFSIRKRKCSA